METEHTVYEIPQALHDSEINFRIECFWDGVWTVALGDESNGWRSEARGLSTFVNGLITLRDMAVREYPDSRFARRFGGVRLEQ